MIPNDQPLRQQTIKRMIDYLISPRGCDDLSNKWERDFIDSVSEQFEKRGDLSSKQCEILERLYDK